MKRSAKILIPLLTAATLAGCNDTSSDANNCDQTQKAKSADKCQDDHGVYAGGGGHFSSSHSNSSWWSWFASAGDETSHASTGGEFSEGGFGESAGAHGFGGGE